MTLAKDDTKHLPIGDPPDNEKISIAADKDDTPNHKNEKICMNLAKDDTPNHKNEKIHMTPAKDDTPPFPIRNSPADDKISTAPNKDDTLNREIETIRSSLAHNAQAVENMMRENFENLRAATLREQPHFDGT